MKSNKLTVKAEEETKIMTIKMYINYGGLPNWKAGYFSPVPAEISTQVELELPDGWKVSENRYGAQLIVAPNGTVYLDADICTEHRAIGGEPVARPYFVECDAYGEPQRKYYLNFKEVKA